MKIITRGAVKRLTVFAAAIFMFCLWGYFTMIKMPGKNYVGPLPELTAEQIRLKDELAQDVQTIAGHIGERNILHYDKFLQAADFIETSLIEANYKVRRQEFLAEGKKCYNLEAELTGSKLPDKIIVVGAHYDSVYGSKGANDNGTGVAATLALARRFAGKPNACTMRFVFFANEEPPYYHTEKWAAWFTQGRAKKKR